MHTSTDYQQYTNHIKIISSLPKKSLQDRAVNDWVRYNFSVQKDNDIVVYRIRDLTSIEGSACGLITQPTIKNGVTYIPLTNNKEPSLKEIWKDVGLCPNDNIANYFAQYAYQAGFTDAHPLIKFGISLLAGL